MGNILTEVILTAKEELDQALNKANNVIPQLISDIDKKLEETKELVDGAGAASKQEVEEVKSSLEQKANVDKFKRVSSEINGVKRERKPILVFVSDDLHPNDWNYRDIFINNGVACSIPIACTNLTDDLVQKCLTLQNNYGYEFGSHTVNHKDLTSITLKEVEYELSESNCLLYTSPSPRD